MTTALWADVAIPVPLRQLFTYRVPPGMSLVAGQRVAVRFGPRKLAGVVVRVREPRADEPAPKGLRDVAAILDGEPLFEEELMRFLHDASEYYLAPPGEVLRAASPAIRLDDVRALRSSGLLERGEKLGPTSSRRKVEMVRLAAGGDLEQPGGRRLGPSQRALFDLVRARVEVEMDELRAHARAPRTVVRALMERGLVELVERDVPTDRFFARPMTPDVPPALSPDQDRATTRLAEAIAAGSYFPFLLYGVTGSGKTEVYLRAVREARARDRGVLVLVPEIGLTPQLVSRFRARFGDRLAVLHSGLKPAERLGFWRAVRSGELPIVIGARSAVFAPVRNLGLIIVDEEHDPSFKQEDGFRYHGRDMALLRAHRAGATCVLGSATPSLESFHLSETGRVERLELPTRVGVHPLPAVSIVDLATHGPGPAPERHRLLTGPLLDALRRCLEGGNQAILFLNRRGFAPSLRCVVCRHGFECASCSVALVLHQRARALRCHYCDFLQPVPERCPACKSDRLEPVGLGTERLEDALSAAFPDARVGRLDRDVATVASAEQVLDRLRARELDVLVGTQMVTKGHDIAGVTLVAVVCADQSLYFPDFRAEERTFQLLAQVAGRAGRGERAGEVLLQTYMPDSPVIELATRHDYPSFVRRENEIRLAVGYPPFVRLAMVRADGKNEERTRDAMTRLADVVERCRRKAPAASPIVLRGPTAAPLAKLRERYRFQMLVSCRERGPLRAALGAVLAAIDEDLPPGVRASVDIDPVAML